MQMLGSREGMGSGAGDFDGAEESRAPARTSAASSGARGAASPRQALPRWMTTFLSESNVAALT